MLYASLVLSGLLLLVVNCTPRKPAVRLGIVVASGLGFSTCLTGTMIILPAVMLQSLLLVVVTLGWCCFGGPRRVFLPLSCGATLAAYAYLGWSVYRERAEMRERFPDVSLEDRLPKHGPKPATPPLPAAAARRLEQFEVELESSASRAFLREAG